MFNHNISWSPTFEACSGKKENKGRHDFFCCASMIMSAFLLVRNVLMRPPKGGHVEEDGDERTRTGAGGGAGASGERRAAFGGCGSADGPELPADGTGVEAIPRGRRDGAEAP